MKKGFTLVELAIVLVIIGLIIGGILTSQSMISTAVVNKQVAQLQQFDIAARNFKNTYGGLPGDNNVFKELGWGCGGDNNGYLDNGSTSGSGCSSNFESTTFGGDREFANFFFQLSKTSMIASDLVTTPFTTSNKVNVGQQLPEAVFPSYSTTTGGKKKLGFIAFGGESIGGNYYYFVRDYSNGHQLANPTGPLLLSYAVSLDTKLDDGMPLTGDVTTILRSQNDLYAAPMADSNCNNSPTNSYRAAASNRNCSIKIKMQVE